MDGKGPSVTVTTGDGVHHELVAGTVIGRGLGAGLQIADPAVSEAHALLSWRDGEFVLLALRGALLVQGMRLVGVAVAPGLRVRLADEVELLVVAVRGAEAGALAGTPPTANRGRVWPPLRVVVDYETTVVSAEAGAEARLLGVPATFFFHLVDFGVPAPWAVFARATWRREPDERKLRWRFDKVVKQVRATLLDAGLRPDLVGHRAGNYFVHLLPGDTLVNLTADP